MLTQTRHCKKKTRYNHHKLHNHTAQKYILAAFSSFLILAKSFSKIAELCKLSVEKESQVSHKMITVKTMLSDKILWRQ